MSFEVVIANLPFLMLGLWVTIKVAFISIIFSLLLGIILGSIRFAKIPVLSYIIGLFVDTTRSIPLILYIIFVHYSFSPYLYENMQFVSYLGINCLAMFSAVIAIIVFTSAYIAEIIRSGLESVEKEQILAAKALALNDYQIIKYVILPQAISRMKPALCAQCITLVKDTSLASAIGLIELTRASEIVYENSLHEFQILVFVALVYITINFLIQKLFAYEKNLNLN